MSKLIQILLLACLFTFALSQLRPRVSKNGTQTYSTIPGWYCTFNFTYNNVTKILESVSSDLTHYGMPRLSLDIKHQIDAVSWNGTSCYCWVLLYEENEFEGYRTGLWVGSVNGTFDLTRYLVQEPLTLVSTSDRDPADENTWDQWDVSVGSYNIFCY